MNHPLKLLIRHISASNALYTYKVAKQYNSQQ